MTPPLDTPHDWFARIARRQAEVEAMGLLEAAKTWHARGECGPAVLAALGVKMEGER